MPSALGRSSQALLGHCCEALQSQQGILGNGMQHDAAPPHHGPPRGVFTSGSASAEASSF